MYPVGVLQIAMRKQDSDSSSSRENCSAISRKSCDNHLQPEDVSVPLVSTVLIGLLFLVERDLIVISTRNLVLCIICSLF